MATGVEKTRVAANLEEDKARENSITIPEIKMDPMQASHVQGNPYRQGSAYAVCFNTLARMGKDWPVSRKTLLAAYATASGKEPKRAGYDLAVILSPIKEGDGHRSSRKQEYWVERLENDMVQLHMVG